MNDELTARHRAITLRLAGRPFQGHQVLGEGVGRERHRDLEARDLDLGFLAHGPFSITMSGSRVKFYEV